MFHRHRRPDECAVGRLHARDTQAAPAAADDQRTAHPTTDLTNATHRSNTPLPPLDAGGTTCISHRSTLRLVSRYRFAARRKRSRVECCEEEKTGQRAGPTASYTATHIWSDAIDMRSDASERRSADATERRSASAASRAGVRPPLEEEDFVSREASNDTPPRRARSLKNGPHRIVQELGEGRQRSHKRREVPALVPELENAVFAFCEKKTSSII